MGAARFSPEVWVTYLASLPPGEDRIQDCLHRLMEAADDDCSRHTCRDLSTRLRLAASQEAGRVEAGLRQGGVHLASDPRVRRALLEAVAEWDVVW